MFQQQPTNQCQRQTNNFVLQAWQWLNESTSRQVMVGLFACATLLRMLVMLIYSTTVLVYYGGDSTRYLRLASTGYRGLFSDRNSPAGYPIFLDISKWFDRNIAFTIGLQHLMGLATAGFLLLLVRKVSGSPWLGLIPAAIVLFSGDFVFLETALLTETLWMFLLAASLWAAMGARKSSHATAWLVAAGALLALATLVRSVALPIAGLVVIWAIWEFRGSWLTHLKTVAAVIVPVAIMLFGYTAMAKSEGGYAGLTDMRGFNLYARTGQFANCHDFSPPKGTAGLCEYTPPEIAMDHFIIRMGRGLRYTGLVYQLIRPAQSCSDGLRTKQFCISRSLICKP